MSKERFEQWGYESFKDNKTGEITNDFLGVMNKQDQKISDLEAKLAESEKEVERLNLEFETQEDWQAKWQKQYDETLDANETAIDFQNQNTELEKDIAELKTENMNIFEYSQKLEQQLAEKDVDLSLARNEIDTLKHNLKVAQEHDNVMCEQYFEKCKKANQDKISFAVEKLELLKEKMANFDLPNNPKLYNNDMFCGGFDSHYIKTKEQIDNQIEELKKEMK